MILTVALIAALAFWDSERQSEATLEDFAQEQTTLASSLAVDIGNRLTDARRDALLAAEQTLSGQPISPRLFLPYLALRVVPATEPAAPLFDPESGIPIRVPVDSTRRIDLRVSLSYLLSDLRQLQRTNALVLLISPPDGSACQPFYTPEGKRTSSPRICKALADEQTSVVIPRQEAAELGLPARMALAGLGRFDGGPLGTWHVAAVSSALRQRDRNQRARWRAVLGVLLASALVLVFGGVALILQRKELEMERALTIADLRRQRDEKLVRASKAATLGTLALGIAHELSTPLGVITGRAEQLQQRLSGDERAGRNLQAILEQANHISQIIRGFLSLCRGHHPPTEPLSPAEVVCGAVALCEHRFAKANVHLTTTVVAELPLIRGDLRLLEHALVNLLLNACDACQKGCRVDVAITKEGDLIIFSVQDNGIGISAAHAERVLEPFFTTKPAEEGTGLGLAIAQEIVKHHRGELHLEPRAGGGTRATIRIPV
jgi:signal transduction histidine kinase